MIRIIKRQRMLLCLLFLCSLASGKLLYGFSMVRHGVLNLKKENKSDMNEQFRLTTVGMRQLYNLGTYLRQDYVNQQHFLPESFDNSVEFYSSSLERTQESAYALQYGLYPLYQGYKIPSNLSKAYLDPPFAALYPNKLRTQPKRAVFALRGGFTLLPVHPIDEILDSCKNYSLFQKERMKQMEQQKDELYDDYSVTIQKMKQLFKLDDNQTDDIEQMSWLYKQIESQQMVNLPMPEDYTQEDDACLKYIYQYNAALKMESKFGKTMVTLPFQFMSGKLKDVASGQSANKMSFLIYHSSNMWPILVHLNLTSSECITQRRDNILPAHKNCQTPFFGSSLIVQLHQNEDTLAKSIKIKYNGNYVNVCGKEEQSCLFEQFMEAIENDEQDFDRWCGPRPGKGFITKKV